MVLLGFLLTAIPFGYILHRFLPNGAMRYVVCTLFILLVFIAPDVETPIIGGMLWGLLAAGVFNFKARE